MLLSAACRSFLKSPAIGASTTNLLTRFPQRRLTTEDVRRDLPSAPIIDPESFSKDVRTTRRGSLRPDGPKKLLTPYELSKRVKALCDKGRLKEAITKLKEAPKDAQNAAVWGTLIREVMNAEKYKEAYRLFTDMKRRGFTPTTRTYSTMLGGYSNIDDWEQYSVQLQNVCSLYTQLQRYHEETKRRDPLSPELSDIPYTQLIKIFGRAQQFQRMYDVFNSMPSAGPLSPSVHTYTALLNAIGNRKASSLVPSVSILDGHGEEKPTAPSHHELMFKNSSDAKLIWRQLVKASTTAKGVHIDSHALRALLKVLGRGRPSDQNFAFDIIHEYFGLAKPGQQAIPPKVELHPLTLESLLTACNNANRYNLTLHYVQQVIDSDSGSGLNEHPLGLRRMLDTRHMDIVLEAYAARAALGSPDESEDALETLEWMHRMQAIPQAPGKEGGIGPQIRPKSSTYELVALTCWRNADWKGACRTFELMTGYDAGQFRGDMRESPQQERRSAGRNLTPSTSFMISLVKASAKTHLAANMQQALNIFEHYGWNTLFPADDPRRQLRRKEIEDANYFAPKLAQALAGIASALSEHTEYDQLTRLRWKLLEQRARSKAQSYQNKTSDVNAHQVTTPETV